MLHSPTRPSRLGLLVLLLGLLLSFQAPAVTLKIATLVPDGTSWMQAMRGAAKEILKRTDGRVKLRFYPGGVMGNDKSVLRKIRAGQLHGGALTAGGLAAIHKDIQIYALPFLFRSFQEVDAIRHEFDRVIIDDLRSKGFISYGLSEAGFVYLMSRTPITDIEQLRQHKVWSPEGDQVSLMSFRAIGVTPIPLPMTDVLTGLQTGLIDTIASSPAGAIALQWHTQVKYLTDTPLLYLYGTLVLKEQALKRLSDGDRKIVREVLTEAIERISKETRQDNQQARQALQKQGIRFITPDPEAQLQWQQIVADSIQQMGRKGVFSPALLQRIQQQLERLRKNK